MVHIVRIFFVKHEVKDANGIYTLEFKVPFTFWGLFLNWEGRVIYATVNKKRLFRLLHLYEKLLPLVVLAIYIKYGFTLCNGMPKMLHVEVLQVFYHLFTVK